jgi:hypothetical protein
MADMENNQTNSFDSSAMLSLMQQGFDMHMQMMQFAWTIPMNAMQVVIDLVDQAAKAAPAEGRDAAANRGGFNMEKMSIPPQLISMLMNLDMSPENLKKLQQGLDFVFGVLPVKKQE